MKLVLPALLAIVTPTWATDLVVAPSGGDYTSIQAALDAAQPGDRVLVEDKPGGWNERLVFPRSGLPAAPIELRAAPGHAPALDGTGVPGLWMITIENRDHLHVRGLEIRNNLGVPNDGSGVRVQGSCAGIELSELVIHDMRGFGAMAITVYGNQAGAPIRDLVIDGCTVYDCEPADSEAITLNGNVTDFAVTNNIVRDVNNIGIDFIGGEFGSAPVFQARNGVCRGNVVLRANANYGGGYGAGIYVDGGRDLVIEHNYVSGCDLGIEVGAENVGVDATNVLVHSNVIVRNEKVGLVFGGYDASVGRVRDCTFANNTLLGNDTLLDGNGEIWVQWAEDCDVVNNVVWPGTEHRAVANYASATGMRFLSNVYYADVPESQVVRIWQGTAHNGLAAWTNATGLDATSLFADPAFVDADGPDDILGDTRRPAATRGDFPGARCGGLEPRPRDREHATSPARPACWVRRSTSVRTRSWLRARAFATGRA